MITLGDSFRMVLDLQGNYTFKETRMSDRSKRIIVFCAFAFVIVLLIIFAVLITLRDAESKLTEETTNESSILLDDWWT